MGQSQFLVIVISVFIIGIAILAGTGFFDSGEIEANKSAIVGDINQIAHLAVRFYAKPSALGGGGHCYAGFAVPNKFRHNQNGAYRAVVLTPTILQVTGLSAKDTNSTVTAQIDTYGKASNWTFAGDFQ